MEQAVTPLTIDTFSEVLRDVGDAFAVVGGSATSAAAIVASVNPRPRPASPCEPA